MGSGINGGGSDEVMTGMGNREWGIGEEDLPTPHPTTFFSPPPPPASSFPIPTIPHSRLPIPTGGVERRE